jgi:integrase
MDVNLHTTDKAKAETYVKLRRAELEIFNSYILAGEPVPAEVEKKLLRRGGMYTEQKVAVPVLRTCLDQFEKELRRSGKRERTIETYLKSIRCTVPLDLTVADFTRNNVRDWMSAHDNCKTSTRKSYSVATREFAKYLINNYDLDPRILNDWPMVNVQQEEKGYWTLAQMYHIIEAIKCVDKKCEEAMKVFCWVMATCGSRQGETGMLRWSDFHDGTLTFRAETTKNNVTRRVPLDMRVAEMLLRLPRTGNLIFHDIPDSQAGRYAIVAKAVKRAKAPHGGLHTFRHSASMLHYSKCRDIKAVAQLLGHGESVALKYYQAARQAEELQHVVDKTFSDETMIPNTMDELVKAGLV